MSQPLPYASPNTPQLAKPVNTRHSLLYWSLFGVAIFIMLGFALLSFGWDLFESGPVAALVGAVAALLLLPVYLAFFLWLDRFEPEPPHLLLAAFVWGAGIAGFFACILNSVFGIAASNVVDPQSANQLMASISAPLMEETLKGLAVAILFFWLKDQFDGVTDGIIYAGMAALGFATIENVSYYARNLNAGGVGGLIVTFVMRGLMSPYTHVLFTSMTGIGFGIARQTKSTPVKFIAPIVGWILAMALHATWNTMPWIIGNVAQDEGTGLALFLGVYALLWIPLFLALLGIIAFSLRQESKLIRRHLLERPEITQIEPQDADRAAKLLPRLVGNCHILVTKGGATWSRMRRFQHATTALAFYRERLERNRIAPNPELEADYIQQIIANKPLPNP